MQGAFFIVFFVEVKHMAALDVRVKLYRNGVLVNEGGSSIGDVGGSELDESTAVLGKARLGKMKLGHA